jgi:hypothetical protein
MLRGQCKIPADPRHEIEGKAAAVVRSKGCHVEREIGRDDDGEVEDRLADSLSVGRAYLTGHPRPVGHHGLNRQRRRRQGSTGRVFDIADGHDSFDQRSDWPFEVEVHDAAAGLDAGRHDAVGLQRVLRWVFCGFRGYRLIEERADQ